MYSPVAWHNFCVLKDENINDFLLCPLFLRYQHTKSTVTFQNDKKLTYYKL